MFWTVFKKAWLSMLIFPPLFLISWIVGTLGSWLISPFLAAYSVVEKTATPGGLWRLFYTHDNTLDGGFDAGIRGYKDPTTLNAGELWWQRVCWICRNPGYGLNALVFGFEHTSNFAIIFEDGIPYPEKDGYWYVIRSDKGWKFFGYRGPKAWVGWNYLNYGGYHQLKTRPWRFK
jgi:hypothetical protein